MTSEIFLDWFKELLKQVKERPLVLLLDGHRTHINLTVIKVARENNVSIIKLPSHTSHRLQPLDVSCFGPLKTRWNQELVTFQRANNFRQLKKCELVDILCSIWQSCLTSSNIKSGFLQSGIFPADRTKYPTGIFNNVKMASYNSQFQEENICGVSKCAQTEKNSLTQSTPSKAGTSSDVTLTTPLSLEEVI